MTTLDGKTRPKYAYIDVDIDNHRVKYQLACDFVVQHGSEVPLDLESLERIGRRGEVENKRNV